MAMQQVRTRRPRGDWREAGACRDEDPDLFFPITSKGPSARQILAAKAVCAGCAVRPECLRFALENRQDAGVWGGMSEDERRMMRRAQAAEGDRLGTIAAASLRAPGRGPATARARARGRRTPPAGTR